MELIEPRNFFYGILIFLSGCLSFRPPEPVTIQTPRSVSKTLKIPGENEVLLTLEIDKLKSVYYTIETTGEKNISKIQAIDEKKVEEGIEHAIALSKQQNKNLVVLIKGDNSASSKQFHILIEALRKKEINRFMLATEPQK